jgi:aromatic-L-amino-acid decarboxylase
MDAINRTGQAFLSHTRVNGRLTIRVAISNLRTEDADLELVWKIVRREAAGLETPA